MPYLPLPNFNYDSGPRRIQSGPNHEGYVVLYSGVESTGANDGFAVLGAPLSGTLALGAWDYDSNWRYVPSTLPSQSGSLNPTPYNVSGALDTYDATRIYTRDTVAGAQAASAIGPETGKVNPRGGALQARSDVTRPETYMYFGGGAPDNQDYSPYNTPDANSAAEGKTGGGVTHRSFESSLLTNVLGSQGTSDRSQWRYHQPVYCKTYTETRRSETPGLMSTPLRYVYRGSASSYNYNYGSELLANKGGFELLPYDDEVLGCPFPVGCPTNSGSSDQLIVGDTLSAVVYCPFVKIEWFNSDNTLLGTGLTYTTTSADIDYRIYFKVTYPDGSTDSSSTNCFPVVIADSLRYWYRRYSTGATRAKVYSSVVDNNGDMYVVQYVGSSVFPAVYKISNDVTQQWGRVYTLDPSKLATAANDFGSSYYLLNTGQNHIDFLAWQWTPAGPPYDYDYPVRIYRYRISKADGSVISTVALDWNPAPTFPPLYFSIREAKVDSDNNYYFVGSFPIQGEILVPCILKFTESFEFVWCRAVQKKVYRTAFGDILCSATLLDGGSPQFLTLNITDSSIIGCMSLSSTTYVVSNYFELSESGNTLNSFYAKFSTSDFANDTNPFQPRSVCRDSDGNIYGVGGYETSVALGRFASVIVYKDSPSDTTVWAKDIRNTFYYASISSINVLSNQLLVINEKLVFVAPWTANTLPVTHNLLLFVFDTETGVLEQCIELKPPDEIGDRVIIQRLPENNKFFVQTDSGYRIRLDITDLPANGNYICTDNVSNKYTASGLVPAASNHTFYRFTSCTPAGFITRNIGSYFTSVSPVVTTSGATGGMFGDFAGQDIP